jgi:hypothetical protein
MIASHDRWSAAVDVDLPVSIDNTAVQIVRNYRLRGGVSFLGGRTHMAALDQGRVRTSDVEQGVSQRARHTCRTVHHCAAREIRFAGNNA